MNCFRIPKDTFVVLSVSGGRTSAYILAKVLEAHGGVLPNNCKAVFQNTGKEKPATYDFIQQMSLLWGVHITWLEYAGKQDKFKVVDYKTANRTGEPFRLSIVDNYMYLPNNVQRTCSMLMKNKTMSWWAASEGLKEIENWVGIRYDEPKRFHMEGIAYERDKNGLAKHYKRSGEPVPVNKIVSEEKVLPLRHAHITKPMILDWWKGQSFDLQLGPNESNCDLCFMKGAANIISEIKRNPSLADWWIDMENMVSEQRGPSTFRSDRPSYSELKIIATSQGDMFFDDSANMDCNCTD